MLDQLRAGTIIPFEDSDVGDCTVVREEPRLGLSIGEIEMREVREGKKRVLAGFEELEELQRARDGFVDRGEEMPKSAMSSRIWDDAFVWSCGWLKGEEEILFKRPRPEIEFVRLVSK
jgi:hypothetical protein